METGENKKENGISIEIEGFKPTIAMENDKKLAAEKIKMASNSNSKRKFKIDKFDQISGSRLNSEDKIVSHSHFHRFLHASFTFILFSTFIALSIFLGSKAENNYLFNVNVQSSGNASLTDEYGLRSKINGDTKIYGGELISTKENSELKIIFPDSSEIRLNELTDIKIKNAGENPKIELLEGQIWVFSVNKINVKVPKANFKVDNGSARFAKNKKIYEATSWRHNIKGELFGESNNKITEFIIPVGKSIFFSPGQIKNEFSKLRLSKLKKELKLHRTSPIDWEDENLKQDEKIISGIVGENYVQTKTDGFFSKGSLRLKTLHNYLALMPAKKSETEKELGDILIKKALKNAEEGDMKSLTATLVENDFSDEQLYEVWKIAILLSNEENFLQAKSEIEDIWLNKVNGKDQALYKRFLDTSLNTIEDFTENGEDKLLAKESKRYQDLWKQYNTKFNGKTLSDLSMHREAIANIAQHFVDRVDPEILNIFAYINDLALINEDEAFQNILRLEIAQDSLALTDTFIEEERFLLARKMINQTDERLKLETVPEIFAIRDKILAKSNLVDEKITFAFSRGELNEEEFQNYIADTKSAERILEELRSTKENNEDNENTSENEEEEFVAVGKEEILNSVREAFSKYGIVLFSYDFEGDSTDQFAIHRAVLPNGKAFSATFKLSNESLSNIQFEDGAEISSGIFLTELQGITDRLFAQMSNEDNVSEDIFHASPDEEEDLSPSYDSTLVSLLKQLTQTKLRDIGITASQKDISIISRQQTNVKKAVIDDLKLEISLIFDTKTMQCTEIVVEEIELPDTNLENLMEVVTNNVEKKERLDELKKSIESDFNKLKFEYEIGKNLTVDLETGKAKFSNVTTNKSEEEFVVYGVYDIENQVFEILAERDGKFKTMNDVEFKNVEDEIISSYETINPTLNKNPGGLSASLLGATWLPENNLREVVSDLFKENGCGFDASNFEVDEDKQIVVFKEVWCNKMEFYGEYNAQKEHFSIIFNPEVGEKRGITLEDFPSEIKNFSKESKNKEEEKEAIETLYNNESEGGLLSENGLIQKMADLFRVYDCEFDSSYFDADEDNQYINFKKVFFNNKEISGVYDAKNDIFISVTCSAFGTRTNLTIEDLSTQISESSVEF